MTGPRDAARQELLARVRAAVRGATPPAIPRTYRRHGEHQPGSAALLDLLTDRLVDYRATVHRRTAEQLAATVSAVLTDAIPAGGRVIVPPGLRSGWVDGAVADHAGLSAADLDGFAAVVTGCAAAVADTGTIVLDGSPDQGRRAITLVPDVHVCVVRADQVVQTVPEVLARLDPRRPLTFISGPSATSDIELTRVEGVHGPRRLHVVLVG
ncbi:MAG TPA: LUD domain-containing protein [Micromonosporaceae bacterium]